MSQTSILAVGTLVLSLFGSVVAQEQPPLGDVAREQRRTNIGTTHHAAHVVTDEDVSTKKQTEVAAATASAEPAGPERKIEKDPNSDPAGLLEAKIKIHKQKIMALKSHIDEIQRQLIELNKQYVGSSTAASANRCVSLGNSNPYRDWCDTAQKLNTDLERTRAAIAAEQKELEQIQQDVRRMGYGNALYDPN